MIDTICANEAYIDIGHEWIGRLENLFSELTNYRQYITGSNIENMPADLEDVTLKELLEIISI